MSTEIAKIPTTREFETQLAGYIKGVGSLVNKEVASRLLRLMAVEAALSPKIRECSPASVMRAVFLSAQLALEPGAVKGELYFIPRETRIAGNQTEMQLTVMIGYKGYLTLARRSGQISMVDAHVVFEGDAYEISLGTDPKLIHVPQKGIDRTKSAGIIGAYCVVKLKDGSTYFEWLWKDEIEARRNRGAKNGPWNTDYAAMARKSAIRALFTGGRVPMADQIGFASAVLDDEADPEIRRAALAGMAEEMRGQGQDASILDVPAEVPPETPPAPSKNALGVPAVNAAEIPPLHEVDRLEGRLPPAEVAAIRKARGIDVGATLAQIPVGYLPKYVSELQAALKALQ